MFITGIALAAVAIGMLFFGFIGVSHTVTAGTQVTLCGTNIGVSNAGEPGPPAVRLLGPTSVTLQPGERARISALCVVEVVSITDHNGSDNSGADTDDGDTDGGSIDVQLRWRLW